MPRYHVGTGELHRDALNTYKHWAGQHRQQIAEKKKPRYLPYRGLFGKGSWSVPCMPRQASTLSERRSFLRCFFAGYWPAVKLYCQEADYATSSHRREQFTLSVFPYVVRETEQ